MGVKMFAAELGASLTIFKVYSAGGAVDFVG
jgi:hypothetical protein